MTGSRKISLFSSLLLGAAAFVWTSAGETSNPSLATRELPADILNECTSAECMERAEYRSRWVGYTAQGNLFVVGRAACAPGLCSHWLVEKGNGLVQVLLELDGSFALKRLTGRYPVVDLRTRSDDSIMQVRFEWNGEQYARTDARKVYAVNGVECGTREECSVAAQRALKAEQVDKALRIWQQVHGVSWI